MRIGFRVDASARLGTGHAMRCTALAAALRPLGASCVFYSRRLPGDLRDWMTSRGHEVVTLPERAAPGRAADLAPWAVDEAADARDTAALVDREARPRWMVVDHYGLGATWETTVRRTTGGIAVVDDLADRAHDADVLVDQNLQSPPDRYAGLVSKRCRQLLGPRHALLRSEFTAARTARARRPGATTRQRVLACVGGTDPRDVLSRVLEAWHAWGGERPWLDVAVGATSPNVDRLRAACEDMEGVALHVQAGNMAELMAQADLFLGSAGSVSWERCCSGLPALIGTTADNQRLNGELLGRRRTGISVGDWTTVPAPRIATLAASLLARPSLLERMSRRAAAVCDGRGAQRVAIALLADGVRLRRAVADDAEKVWPWRNAFVTRRHFTNPSPVPWPEHVAWWSRTLKDPERELLIAEVGPLAVGVLRFDRKDAEAVVSVYLDPDLHGLGLGRRILEAGRRHVASTSPSVATLIADVMPANVASAAAFERAGYARHSTRWTRGVNE
jgi:UDP-2,4-diacetamido-2,4,6-trideoxy-beta-L-altropyranose hydrolase